MITTRIRYALYALGIVVLAILLGYLWGSFQFSAGERAQAGKQKTAQRQFSDVTSVIGKTIETRYVDRVKVVKEAGETIVKRVPIYVTAKDDSACTINNGFVSLWNSTNQMQLPNSSGITDAAVSPTVLSDIAAQHVEESANYQRNYEQGVALQDWIKSMQAASLQK